MVFGLSNSKSGKGAAKIGFCALVFALIAMNASIVLAESPQEAEKVRDFFLIHNNDNPSTWASQIVLSFLDEEEKHADLLNEMAAFSGFYASSANISFDFSEDAPLKSTSFGIVIANFDIQNEYLGEPIKKKLTDRWSGSPLETSINARMSRISFGQSVEGDSCAIFVNGQNREQAPTEFSINSALILANSALPKDDIKLCLMNKISVAFGLAPALFDHQREAPQESVQNSYYGLFPQILNYEANCRRLAPESVMECISQVMGNTSRYLLNNVLAN